VGGNGGGGWGGGRVERRLDVGGEVGREGKRGEGLRDGEEGSRKWGKWG